MTALEERLQAFSARIDVAARSAGRDPTEITTIVVTKFQPASLVRELFSLDVRDIGENRHQEAQAKASELADLDLALALHRPVAGQQGKGGAALRDARSTPSTGSRWSATSAPANRWTCSPRSTCPVSPAAVAFSPTSCRRSTEAVLSAADLRLRGLMTVAPLDMEPARAFAQLRVLGERVSAVAPDAMALSMGMSGDFEEAIREGATHLRIGTAITGNRPPAG